MLLEVTNLELAYGEVPAVRDLSFQVADGEIVTLIGANGAGKSTTMIHLQPGYEIAGGMESTPPASFAGGATTLLPARKAQGAMICTVTASLLTRPLVR